jgi:hypothetical protein
MQVTRRLINSTIVLFVILEHGVVLKLDWQDYQTDTVERVQDEVPSTPDIQNQPGLQK